MDRTSLQQPVVAGVVTAPVGFTSSFAVVLAGLRGVGAVFWAIEHPEEEA